MINSLQKTAITPEAPLNGVEGDGDKSPDVKEQKDSPSTEVKDEPSINPEPEKISGTNGN